MIMTIFKKLMILGIDELIEFRSKTYVLKKIYKNARRSPFIKHLKYEEYLKFLINQITELEGEEFSIENENDLFDVLVGCKWIKEKSL